LFDHDKVQTHAHDFSRGAAGADGGRHGSYRGLAHRVRQRAGASIDVGRRRGQPAAGGGGRFLVGTDGAGLGLTVCRAAVLKVTVDSSQAGGAAGSAYYPVNFTNTSAVACGLYGYPGMSFVTAAEGAGRQIGAAAQRDPAFAKLSVRLPAGGVAHAWLQVAQAGNYPASACQPVTAHWLRVFPPGDTAASYVDVSFSACATASAHLLTVTPVRSGRGVRGVTP
jgi:hypothetical protein